MNIDFEKLLKLLLPTFLRSGLVDLVKAIAYPFTTIYTAWKTWYNDIILQSSITCQVIYLELIINYRIFGSYNRVIFITDGDQVTYDFIVNVPSGTVYNVQLLIGLLEKYKATGKRYTINQTAYEYEYEWGSQVCEKVDRTFDFVWSSPVCEKVQPTENLITIQKSGNSVVASSQFPVTSHLMIDIGVYDSGLDQHYYTAIEIVQGASSGTSYHEYTFNVIDLVHLNITADDNYVYTYTII